MCHQGRRLLLRLAVRDGLHFDLAQLLLPSLHRLLIQVVEDACTQGIALHVHHGGGAVPAGGEQAGVTVDAARSHQGADVTAGCDVTLRESKPRAWVLLDAKLIFSKYFSFL